MDFLSNSQFPKKTNQATQPLVKKYCSLSSTYKKYIILWSLIQRLPLGALLEMTVPWITKISMKNISLLKGVLFRDSFRNNLETFENCYQKCLCWSVSIKESHYSNKNFCNIDLNNFLIIFAYMYKKHELITGFIFWNNILDIHKSFEKYTQKLK